jgi:hypothetical protein
MASYQTFTPLSTKNYIARSGSFHLNANQFNQTITMTTTEKQKLISEFKPVLDEAIYIGLVPENKRFITLSLAVRDRESLNNTKSLFTMGRAALCAQFDERARNGELETLKHSDPGHFKKLWRAKFNCDPK